MDCGRIETQTTKKKFIARGIQNLFVEGERGEQRDHFSEGGTQQSR